MICYKLAHRFIPVRFFVSETVSKIIPFYPFFTTFFDAPLFVFQLEI